MSQNGAGDQNNNGKAAEMQQPHAHKKISIRMPSSKKEIFDMFTLSRTNQILQGHSPTTVDSLSPRPSAKARTPQASRKWMELVAAELFSAKISVVPKAAEFNANRLATDPRRGRYQRKRDFGAPYNRLCKLLRKQLINNIIRKHALLSVTPRVDSNLGKKIPSKRDLEKWKLKRARKVQERSSRKRRKVVSTKRKRLAVRMKACHTCGDFHFRKSCASMDMKINLLVKQIHQKTEVIRECMTEAWEKIDTLEDTFHDMLQKVHRLQSNRVCLGMLTGENYPGENHPFECPCVEQRLKEERDRARLEERKREEELRKREEEERKEKERVRRERIIELRKKRFYTKMQKDDQQFKRLADVVQFKDLKGAMSRAAAAIAKPPDPTDHSSSTTAPAPSRLSTTVSSGDRHFLDEFDDVFDPGALGQRHMALLGRGGATDLTHFEASRRKSRLTIMGGLEDEPLPRPSGARPGLLARARQRGLARAKDLVIMDGSVKTLEEQFFEQGGMVRQETTVESLPGGDLFDEEDQGTEEDLEDMTLDEEANDEEEEEVQEVKPAELPKEAEKEPALPFGEFLDLMEVF
jgi:hypothetical protein